MPGDPGGKPTLPLPETVEPTPAGRDREFITVQEWSPDVIENGWLTGKKDTVLRVIFSDHLPLVFHSRGSGIITIIDTKGKDGPVHRCLDHEMAGDRLVRAVLLTRCLQQTRFRATQSTAALLRQLKASVEYMQEIIRLLEEVEGLGFDAVITLPPIVA